MNDGGLAANPKRRRILDTRVDQQPAFVLHSYPWRETSLIVDVLTRDFGRIALVARGAKRPTSQLRGLLSPFNPVAVSWSGRAEIKTMVRVDWLGGLAPLRGDGLLAAFYVNELIVRLLARADPHERLFGSYVQTLRGLAQEGPVNDAVLREFELDLLREIGHLPPLDHCAAGEPIDAAASYKLDHQHGFVRVEDAPADDDVLVVHGDTIDALARRDFSDPRAAAASKAILRQLIRYHLEGKPLNTRRILQDLKRL
jgi:DNA repair protein RecO (recombination protein O)